MDITPLELGQILAGFTNAALSAPASANQAAHENSIVLIQGVLTTMSDNITKLLAEQAKLQADVSEQTTVIASATTALTGLTGQLAAAEAAAKAAGVTDEQIAGFTTLRTTLETNTASLAAAVAANTAAAAEPSATVATITNGDSTAAQGTSSDPSGPQA
jgi:hypothetical protein